MLQYLICLTYLTHSRCPAHSVRGNTSSSAPSGNATDEATQELLWREICSFYGVKQNLVPQILRGSWKNCRVHWKNWWGRAKSIFSWPFEWIHRTCHVCFWKFCSWKMTCRCTRIYLALYWAMWDHQECFGMFFTARSRLGMSRWQKPKSSGDGWKTLRCWTSLRSPVWLSSLLCNLASFWRCRTKSDPESRFNSWKFLARRLHFAFRRHSWKSTSSFMISRWKTRCPFCAGPCWLRREPPWTTRCICDYFQQDGFCAHWQCLGWSLGK